MPDNGVKQKCNKSARTSEQTKWLQASSEKSLTEKDWSNKGSKIDLRELLNGLYKGVTRMRVRENPTILSSSLPLFVNIAHICVLKLHKQEILWQDEKIT